MCTEDKSDFLYVQTQFLCAVKVNGSIAAIALDFDIQRTTRKPNNTTHTHNPTTKTTTSKQTSTKKRETTEFLNTHNA